MSKARHNQFLEVGHIIGGRYRVTGAIGSGGMSVVYAARDLKLAEMLRAVKVTAGKNEGMRQYPEEAALLMKLNHPHLPQIVDYFELTEAGTWALVMDYFDGETVKSHIEKNKNGCSYSLLSQIALQLCSALSYLHSQTPPIIHRDLKPSNVMIGREGSVKLIDFGISRLYNEERTEDTERLGTVGFAAPEQTNGGQSDARTDIFGLGALLYYMASGGAIYRSEGRGGIRAAAYSASTIRSDIPKAFLIVVDKMLQTAPSDRFQSMKEVKRELQKLQHLAGAMAASGSSGGSRSFNGRNSLTISVLSLSSGAGASFLTLALAQSLAQNHVPVTAVEFCELKPEWHALFSRSGRHGRRSNPQHHPFDERYALVEHDGCKLSWLALHPERATQPHNGNYSFAQLMRQWESPVRLLDLSGKWQCPMAAEQLLNSRFVLAVADPSVYKWQAAELHALNRLSEKLRSSGGSLLWIANKDTAFKGRREWLSLFPSPPAAILPELPLSLIMQAHYEGRMPLDDERIKEPLQKALRPLVRLLNRELGASAR